LNLWLILSFVEDFYHSEENILGSQTYVYTWNIKNILLSLGLHNTHLFKILHITQKWIRYNISRNTRRLSQTSRLYFVTRQLKIGNFQFITVIHISLILLMLALRWKYYFVAKKNFTFSWRAKNLFKLSWNNTLQIRLFYSQSLWSNMNIYNQTCFSDHLY
jgi:hypothetical protein